MEILVLAGFITAVMLLVIFIGKRENLFLKEVSMMTDKQKGLLLIQATILRLSQEKNPLFSEYSAIFLNPESYPPSTCQSVYSALLDQIVRFKKVRKQGEKNLQKVNPEVPLEVYEEHMIYLEHGLRVWMQTIGSQFNKNSKVDALALWRALSSGFPYVPEALQEFKSFSSLLGESEGLGGFTNDTILKEAVKQPDLTIH